jgi:hypothetical protein
MRLTEDEYLALIGEKKPKKSKYNNRKVKVDGMTFASQKEADYYCSLKLLHRAGEIKGFCRQPRFLLLGCEYVADFIIWNNDGTTEIIDTKGMRTDVYKVKIKQFKELYPDLRFKEVK